MKEQSISAEVLIEEYQQVVQRLTMENIALKALIKQMGNESSEENSQSN